MEVVEKDSEIKTLQSLLASIQLDHTFKYHLQDPEILLGVCQSVIQKFPEQAKDIHLLMERGEIQMNYHKPIPEYVQIKIKMVIDLCENLQIPFPLHALLLQSSDVDSTSLLLRTELFFNENSLEYSNPYDFSIGIDIGGSNARVAVYHSSTGEIEAIRGGDNSSCNHVHEYQFSRKGLTYFDILRLAKMNAEKQLKHAVWKVFVCLPMDATLIDRLQLRHAALSCHLELLGTSNSPQLTAFSYGTHVNKEHSVVICDIGAKSIDIGYFLIEEGFVEVKSINFNDSLGIMSLTTLLFDYYQKEISSRFQSLLPDDPFSKAHLMTLCEQLVVHLSTHETGEMICHSVLDTLHYKKPITRVQFEEICNLYFMQLEQWLLTIFTNEFPSLTVDEILLIGGGSNLPIMKTIFQKYLTTNNNTKMTMESEDEISKEVKVFHDEYSGVKGAALLSALRSHQIPTDRELSQSLLVDVATHDISLIIAEVMQSVIVPRCTSIPLVKSQQYTTTYDNQTAVLIHVVESIREDEGINKSTTIGWFIFENLPSLPQGELKINVVIDISSSYEVKVTAQELQNGISKSVVMTLNQFDEIPSIPVYLNPQKLFLEHCPT